MHDNQINCAESSMGASTVWNWINGLQVPLKIRFFLWRCAKGILPVGTELVKRNVECDIVCRRCGLEPESIEHCLRDCAWSSFFWNISPLRLVLGVKDACLSLLNWFERIAKIDDYSFHNLFAVLIWSCWKNRNELIFKNVITTQKVWVDMAVKIFHEYQEAKELTSSPIQQTQTDSWQSPPEDSWKVNVDAVCGQNGEGLLLAKEMGCMKLILETDCQSIYFQLKSEVTDWSYRGAMCDSIRNVASQFDEVRYSWARRTANLMAHSLAKLAISNNVFFSYTGALPSTVLSNIPPDELASH
ncbi:hypothetical protein C2S51_029245 [Perilla frutescens var. frutescens]|nr:hypothetical protein C2S51_029245 [Perilla frutescens var. frutescens]